MNDTDKDYEDIFYGNISQGRKKIIKVVNTLIRNKYFLKTVKRYRKMKRGSLTSRKITSEDYNKEKDDIILQLKILKRRALKLSHTNTYKMRQGFSWRYGLDNEMLDYSIALIENDLPEASVSLRRSGEICYVEDDIFHKLAPLNDYESFFELDVERQIRLYSFPVSMHIHRLASKRDVINFIEKNWDGIRIGLEEFGGGRYKMRSQKIDQNIFDLIWKHRGLQTKDIKDILYEKFPKNGLTKQEIVDIRSKEKRKRSEKIDI